MNEQEIKEKIAYDFHERLKRFDPETKDDRERDWAFACRVYEHFNKPIQPTNAKWLSEREDYQEYQRYF